MPAGFRSDFNQLVDRLNRRVFNRISGDVQLKWLFSRALRSPFMPDYFLISEFGRTRWEEWAHSGISALAPPIWKQSVWPRIESIVMSKLNHKYLPRIMNISHPHTTWIQPEFNQLITQFFKHPYPHFSETSFNELFLFLTECLRLCQLRREGPLDMYEAEKTMHDEVVTKIYLALLEQPHRELRWFKWVTYLSIRANWIDIFEDDIRPFLRGFYEELNDLLSDDSILSELEHRSTWFSLSLYCEWVTDQPKTILYELDNSGEVILDLLAVEWMLEFGHDVILAAKSKPVMNDVTHADLRGILDYDGIQTRLRPFLDSGQLQTLETGSGGAGKYVFEVTPAYKAAYEKAELLILKGQGNFATMPMGARPYQTFYPYPYRKKIVYMMGVKAELIYAGLTHLFSAPHRPPKGVPFLYCFDPDDRDTWPK